MSDRFFHPALAECDSVLLDGAEAHHLIHVLRAKPGREVVLFDGSGWEFLARVERVERSAVRLVIVSRQEVDRELPVRLTLGAALPKGERQRWLVEKATELGVTELMPLVTERGVAQPTDDARRRLERAVVEASKQCGRNRLMTIAAPARWDEFVGGTGQGAEDRGQGANDRGSSEIGGRSSEVRDQSSEVAAAQSIPCPLPLAPCPSCIRLVAHPGGTSLAALDQLRGAAEFVLAIGPEGGFTDPEVQEATVAGWIAIDLGKRILRVETAAIALVSAITSQIG